MVCWVARVETGVVITRPYLVYAGKDMCVTVDNKMFSGSLRRPCWIISGSILWPDKRTTGEIVWHKLQLKKRALVWVRSSSGLIGGNAYNKMVSESK